MKKIGKVKGRGKIKGLDFGKGWYNESVRHGLASRGILTGRKREEPEIEKTKTTDIKPLKELTARGFVVAAIQFAPIPMARELYIGYGTARLVYSSWSMIYNAYKNPNTLKQETYNYTSYQTGLIWDNIEDRVSEPFKNEAHNQLKNISLNTTEEVISLVENALAF